MNKRQKKCNIGYFNSHYYRLVFDRRENQSYCDPQYGKNWRWFLWASKTNNPPNDDDFIGDFSTKNEAFGSLI